MKKLHSIKQISKVYDTGDKPVLVQCNDLNEYVCKHGKGNNICYNLFTEYIAYRFLAILDVKLAPCAFIQVKENHILPSGACQPLFFKEIDCFGTELLNSAEEWSAFSFEKKSIKHIKNQEDIFKIGWFDIWLANDDRSWNNFNLLMNPEEDGWYIIPIDHGACLNTLSFSSDRKLYVEDNTIIDTTQFKLIAKRHFKNMKEVDEFIKRLYLCIQKLEQSYDEIIANIPSSWKIPTDYIQSLKENLFSKEWLNETKTQFLSLTKSSLKLK